MTEWQQKAVQTVYKYWDLGNKIYNISLPYPRISFLLKGRTAGQASGSIYLSVIEINGQLLEENGQRFIDDTPGHEVAHIFSFAVHGIQRTPQGKVKMHGHGWRKVMMDFGLEPKRCHNYNITNVQGCLNRPFVYTCSCRKYYLTQIRHHRITAMGKTYYCRHCKKTLNFLQIAA